MHLQWRALLAPCNLVAYDSMTYEIVKAKVSIRMTAPYSDKRRRAANEFAKKNGITGTKKGIDK